MLLPAAYCRSVDFVICRLCRSVDFHFRSVATAPAVDGLLVTLLFAIADVATILLISSPAMTMHCTGRLLTGTLNALADSETLAVIVTRSLA
jgi:hypothetical protein